MFKPSSIYVTIAGKTMCRSPPAIIVHLLTHFFVQPQNIIELKIIELPTFLLIMTIFSP